MSNENNIPDDVRAEAVRLLEQTRREQAEAQTRHLIETQRKVFPIIEVELPSSEAVGCDMTLALLDKLVTTFHVANGLSDKEQVLGLLQTISQGAGQLAAHLAGYAPEGGLSRNPLPGLFFQFDMLRRHFPKVDQTAVLESQRTMVDMYFIKPELVEKAIAAYAEQGVTVAPVEALVRADGSKLYTLRMIKHVPPEGKKSAFNEGQLLWYFDTEALPTTPEAEWNPFYEPPEPEETYGQFGEQPFVGQGSTPVIVNNGFVPADDVPTQHFAEHPYDVLTDGSSGQPAGRGESPVIQHIDDFGYVNGEGPKLNTAVDLDSKDWVYTKGQSVATIPPEELEPGQDPHLLVGER